MRKIEPPASLFGRLLYQVQQQRKLANDLAIRDLWKRNGLNPGAKGYKLASTKTVMHDGREITEHRLYKLIDSSVVTVSSEVRHSVETGIDALPEHKKPYGQQDRSSSDNDN